MIARIVRFGSLALAFLLAIAGPSFAQQSNAGVERFVDAPAVRSATLSPSGAYVAYIRYAATTPSIVVHDVATGQERIVQSLRQSVGDFHWVAWKGDDRLLFAASVLTTYGGDSETGSRVRPTESGSFRIQRVFAVDRDGANLTQMFEGQTRRLAGGLGSTGLLDALPRVPDQVLLTAIDNGGVGVWRANVRDGSVEKIADGSWDTQRYVTDGEGYPVMRIDELPGSSGYQIHRRAPGARQWVLDREARRVALATNSPDFQPLGPAPGAGRVYVLARTPERDRTGVFAFDTATGALGDALYEGAASDVNGIVVDRASGAMLAACEFAQRFACVSQDRGLQRHFSAVDQFFEGNATVRWLEASDNGAIWLLSVAGPRDGGGVYLYDRNARRVSSIATSYPSLDYDALSPVEIVDYRARDGAELWAYVTARDATQRPMVVLPHGGPEARDYFGFDNFAQFLASRGYLVLQPNFRGSLGFGRDFADAGRGQWGGRMQDDVTDAVRHMVETGRADPNRICIVGASYGGYVALAGVAFTPELYKCAVSIAGDSDLLEVLREERSNGSQAHNYQYWLRSIGDPRANRDALIAVSPARQAANIRAPVLLIHGELDETVPIRQSELMQQALAAAGRPTRLVRLPDSDHYWSSWRTEHRLTLYRETEGFLAEHLAR